MTTKASITTADIARASGVSTATVSYVLNNRAGTRISEATRKRVLKSISELGYRRNGVAMALKTGRMHSVGLVSSIGLEPSQQHSFNTYGPQLFLELSLSAARAGMSANIFVDAEGKPLHPETVMDGRVDGIIFFAYYDTPDWIKEAYRLGLPCVEIASSFGRFQVHQDNKGGTQLAIKHLLDLGHRRIAHWRGDLKLDSSRARHDTFVAATAEAGLAFDEASIVSNVCEFKTLMQGPMRPTALFARDTALAVQAYDIACDLGFSIPDDLSVIGYGNDLRSTTLRPALTTVYNPFAEMAGVTIDMLRAQIDGLPIVAEVEAVHTYLIERHSTARPTQR